MVVSLGIIIVVVPVPIVHHKLEHVCVQLGVLESRTNITRVGGEQRALRERERRARRITSPRRVELVSFIAQAHFWLVIYVCL